jgi:hypothetical protein
MIEHVGHHYAQAYTKTQYDTNPPIYKQVEVKSNRPSFGYAGNHYILFVSSMFY